MIAGLACASSLADAAVVFYDGSNGTPAIAGPGITFTNNGGGEKVQGGIDLTGAGPGFMALRSNPGGALSPFTTGTDLVPIGSTSSISAVGNWVNGYGGVPGAANYMNISFDGDDGVYEAVAEMYLDLFDARLIAIAMTNAIPNPQNLTGVGGSALSISAGKAMIDAARTVPEPSSLALLALGATCLAARRSRKTAG